MHKLAYEGLEVYQRALDFLVFAKTVVEALPRGNSHITEQMSRASLSIVLNIAEGAGKISGPDKRRFYLSARGSATECGALLDACMRLGLVDEGVQQTGKGILVRIVPMLVALARACEE